ncbi:MAG: methyltransferase domain-containing protein [Clostridiales Family XIII bacterium]|jgi:ubiquinone/menaquinone biosynthesis C-methylase UbiE|nr:methyltransferase domain-containing protein [Clostridiales Family XIII bacterium]
MVNEIIDQIREDYAVAAVHGDCLCETNAYADLDLGFIPDEVLRANQGCASPLAMLDGIPAEGRTIVDLGCGAGLDVFLAAQLVGASGRAIGIDMTAEMLKIAEAAAPQVAAALGFRNTEFHLAQIEQLPLADSTVDMITSNCVVNLSVDKAAVFAELFRALKPGGNFIISDVFATSPIPNYIRNDSALISRCIGGAMAYKEFFRLAFDAGFRDLRTRRGGRYTNIDGYDFLSLTVEGAKPANKAQQGARYALTAEGATPANTAQQEARHALLVGAPSRVVTAFGVELERGKAVAISGSIAEQFKTSAYRAYIRLFDSPPSLQPGELTSVLPAPGPCNYKGKFAMLTGPFIEVEDDDKHVYRIGEPLEICEKTAAVLDSEAYNPLFVIVDKAGNRDVDALDTNCGDDCCC